VISREPLPTAPSAQFRRRPFIEAAGESFRCVPLGPARDWLKSFYYSALMLRTGGRGISSTLPHGEVVRALPKHRHLSWNPAEYEAFRAAVKPGATALDVGANVGAYSLLLGQWVGDGGHVFAFEPAPEIFAGLSQHVALNGLGRVVAPVQLAVGEDVRTASLLVAGTHGESRLAAGADEGGSAIDVSMTTIDRFCEERRLAPDFMKVDVEGFELSVLRGARETIRRAGRGLALFVEMHPSVWPVIGTSKAEMLAELDAQQLDIVSLAPTSDVWALEGICVRLARR
jgi:FkbM family methyltransferase